MPQLKPQPEGNPRREREREIKRESEMSVKKLVRDTTLKTGEVPPLRVKQ